MFAYILIVAVPLLVAFFLLKLKKVHHLNRLPYQHWIISSFFFMFWMLLAFRASEVGVDTDRYLNLFDVTANYSWNEVIEGNDEWLFTLLSKLINSLFDNRQMYLAIVALITVAPISRMYMEKSEDPLITISIYLILPMFAMQFSGLKQSIAMAFVPLAFTYVQKKDLIRFLITIAIAGLFHLSAWTMVILYPVYWMHMTRKTLIWSIPLLVAVFVLRTRIFTLLIPLMGRINEEYSGYTFGNTGAYSMLLLFVIMLIFSYLFLDEKKADQETIGLRNILILSVAIQIFALVSTIAMRVNYYFLLFLPILLPKILHRMKDQNRWASETARYIMCVYFIVYFLEKAYNQRGYMGIYPYIPFWNA